MRPRTLAVLTALALLFAGYIFFVERRLPSTDERAEQEKKVLDFEPEDVAALEIAWDDESVRLVRESRDDDASDSGDEWRLETPLITARADRAAVDGLLDRLAGLEKTRTIEDVDRAGAGFETARATVTLHFEDSGTGGETVLEIGPEVPASSSMIVALDGASDLYQVEAALYDAVIKAPGDWRDKAVFPGTRADIERLRLLPAGEAEVLLAERGDQLWIESPVADRADRDLATALISALTGLRASRFVDPKRGGETLDLAAYGLAPAPALGIIEVQLEGRETPVTVELGKPVPSGDGDSVGEEDGAGEVYARIGEQVFSADGGALLEALARPADGWRSRRWLDLQVFEIERVEIADGEGEVTLERVDGEWLRDGEVAIDYATASDLLYALVEVRADAVLDGDGDGDGDGDALGARQDARLTVSIGREPDPDGTQTEGVRLTVHDGAGPEQALLATESGRSAVLRLAPDALEDVIAKLAAVRAAEAIADQEPSDQEPVQ